MKEYIIFAGTNGVGKSTLYQTNQKIHGIPRVNMDEIVGEFGSWRNTSDVSKAGMIAVRKIKECITKGESFNQETTLCGKSAVRTIQKAKRKGYRIVLYYVGVETIDIAKDRVRQRVLNGGHGIPESDIERRYTESIERLKEILHLCDVLEIYDNTNVFRRVARIQNGQCMERIKDCPKWAMEIIAECQ